jgi:predicted metalloprotease with PDZ domain
MNDEKYVDKTIPKGLRPWDTIIGIDNTFINNGVEFSDKLINYHIGDRINVSIIRDKRFLRIKDVLVKVLHIDVDKMYGVGAFKPKIEKKP